MGDIQREHQKLWKIKVSRKPDICVEGSETLNTLLANDFSSYKDISYVITATDKYYDCFKNTHNNFFYTLFESYIDITDFLVSNNITSDANLIYFTDVEMDSILLSDNFKITFEDYISNIDNDTDLLKLDRIEFVKALIYKTLENIVRNKANDILAECQQRAKEKIQKFISSHTYYPAMLKNTKDIVDSDSVVFVIASDNVRGPENTITLQSDKTVNIYEPATGDVTTISSNDLTETVLYPIIIDDIDAGNIRTDIQQYFNTHEKQEKTIKNLYEYFLKEISQRATEFEIYELYAEEVLNSQIYSISIDSNNFKTDFLSLFTKIKLQNDDPECNICNDSENNDDTHSSFPIENIVDTPKGKVAQAASGTDVITGLLAAEKQNQRHVISCDDSTGLPQYALANTKYQELSNKYKDLEKEYNNIDINKPEDSKSREDIFSEWYYQSHMGSVLQKHLGNRTWSDKECIHDAQAKFDCLSDSYEFFGVTSLRKYQGFNQSFLGPGYDGKYMRLYMPKKRTIQAFLNSIDNRKYIDNRNNLYPVTSIIRKYILSSFIKTFGWDKEENISKSSDIEFILNYKGRNIMSNYHYFSYEDQGSFIKNRVHAGGADELLEAGKSENLEKYMEETGYVLEDGYNLLTNTTNGYSRNYYNISSGLGFFGFSLLPLTKKYSFVSNFISNDYTNSNNTSFENYYKDIPFGIEPYTQAYNPDGEINMGILQRPFESLRFHNSLSRDIEEFEARKKKSDHEAEILDNQKEDLEITI